MKNFKKVLALVLVLATLMGFATVAGAAYKDAADISGDYTEAVKVLELIETMEGYPDGTFGPKKTITREEAAKLIAIFDNKDSDISTYYTSINPFADEKGRWGESYVGYGYRAGIIAGMNATTYAPTANVTGTQFLKMALVTLGYDQEAEGFVGSSWAVNVLALARKLDLIDGLADGWKAEKDLTREEAAQILLNTLKADTVEYAQEAKQVGFKPTATKNAAGTEVSWTWGGRIYLTVAGAVSTGKPLYDGFGLKKGVSFDAFMRPYVKWTKGNDSVEVMEAPKATFTTRFSACDLLAELGVKKTDTDTEIVIDGVYNNGVISKTDALMTGNGADYKIGEEYVTRPADGSKHGSWILDKDFGIWSHENSTCKNPSAAKHGAQGTLTQVFYNGKDAEGNKHYYVTSIETWLGKVGSVTTKTTSRDEHIKKDGAVKLAEVYTMSAAGKDTFENFNEYREQNGVAVTGETGHDYLLKQVAIANLTYDDPTGIEKDDYVLLTYSFKTKGRGYEGIQSLDVVEGKEGRLNGYRFGSAAVNPSETRIAGEFIKDAVHFSLNYDWSKTDDFGTYTFFYDAYGNVIGMKDASDTSKYGVIDVAWVEFGAKGTADLKADVVGLDGETAEEKSVKDFTPYSYLQNKLGITITSNKNFAYDVAKELNLKTNGEGARDFKPLYDHLYKVSVDTNGKYTFEIEDGKCDDNSAKLRSAGSLNNIGTEIKLSNKKATMTITDNAGNTAKVSLTSETQFLVHNMDGTYDEYTGYKNVPSLLAHYVEYVMDSDNKFAEVVYLTNDVYTTDSKFIAYVGEPADWEVVELKDDGNKYYALDVYVDGELKTVYIDDYDMPAYFTGNDIFDTFVAGFYQFQYVTVDGDQIVRVVKAPTASTHAVATDVFTGNDKYLGAAVKMDRFNKTVLHLNNGDDTTYVLADDCAVYGIYKKKVDTITTLDDILADYDKTATVGGADGNTEADAYKVFFRFNDDDEVTALYFVHADND